MRTLRVMTYGALTTAAAGAGTAWLLWQGFIPMWWLTVTCVVGALAAAYLIAVIVMVPWWLIAVILGATSLERVARGHASTPRTYRVALSRDDSHAGQA